MRIRRASEYRRSRWKNDKGETLEVAIQPVSATLDNFDWRISIALLEATAEFSQFSGVDRTLTIISGDGIVLRIGNDFHRLDQNASPLRFAGDCPANAELIAGNSADLNVMTRRGAADHFVRHLTVDETAVGAVNEVVAVFAVTDVMVSMPSELPLSLAPWDMIELSPRETVSLASGRALEVRVNRTSS